MEFQVHIEIGNAEMSDGGHVADALTEVADVVYNADVDNPASMRGMIYDVNGNAVGSYGLERV